MTTDPEDNELLRPPSLEEFVGQQTLRQQLQVVLQAAKGRGDALEHMLFAGPPGLGKTTLANIMAHEMGSKIVTAMGPSIVNATSIYEIFLEVDHHDFVFIDEIHRMRAVAEEVLYSVMEDFRSDALIKQGSDSKIVAAKIPPFTLIGATTRQAMLTGPLRDRFGLTTKLSYYPNGELSEVILRSAAILGTDISNNAACALAERSRGTPRVANRILRRVRDYAQVNHQPTITYGLAVEALDLFQYGPLGLEEPDWEILNLLAGGKPVGLRTIAQNIGEQVETVEDVYEPFLVRQGLIQRSPKGRLITPEGKKLLAKRVDQTA